MPEELDPVAGTHRLAHLDLASDDARLSAALGLLAEDDPLIRLRELGTDGVAPLRLSEKCGVR